MEMALLYLAFSKSPGKWLLFQRFRANAGFKRRQWMSPLSCVKWQQWITLNPSYFCPGWMSVLQSKAGLSWACLCVPCEQVCHQTCSPWSRSDESCAPRMCQTKGSCVISCGLTLTRTSWAGVKMTEECPSLLVLKWLLSSSINMIWISYVELIRYFHFVH